MKNVLSRNCNNIRKYAKKDSIHSTTLIPSQNVIINKKEFYSELCTSEGMAEGRKYFVKFSSFIKNLFAHLSDLTISC